MLIHTHIHFVIIHTHIFSVKTSDIVLISAFAQGHFPEFRHPTNSTADGQQRDNLSCSCVLKNTRVKKPRVKVYQGFKTVKQEVLYPDDHKFELFLFAGYSSRNDACLHV